MGLQQALDSIQLIHQAFEQGYQGELARKKQESDIALAQEDAKRRNAELELHRKEAESSLQLQLAQLQNAHAERLATGARLLREGILQPNMIGATPNQTDDTGAVIPNSGNPGQKGPVDLGDGGPPITNYQLPNEAAQQQADQQKFLINTLAPAQAQAAALTTTAQEQASEPFKVKENQRQVAGKIAENAPQLQTQKDIAAQTQVNENKRAQLAANSTLGSAQIRANAERYSAQLNNFVAPEQQGMITDQANLVAGGAAKLPSGKAGEMISLLLSKSGMVPPDSKDIDTLKSIPTVVETLQDIRKFNINYGTNSDVKAYLNGKLAESALPTDIRAALGSIHTRAITLGKTLGEVSAGKMTKQQLDLINNGLIYPGADLRQNTGLVDNLDKLANDATSKALTHYSPIQRQHIIETNGLSDFVDNGGNLMPGVTKPLAPQIENLFKDIPPTSNLGGRLQKNKTVMNYLKTGKFIPIYN